MLKTAFVIICLAIWIYFYFHDEPAENEVNFEEIKKSLLLQNNAPLEEISTMKAPTEERK